MSDCLFCKIVAGDIPSAKVYEDEFCYAFRDIHPQAPTHVLVVSKAHVANLTEAAALPDNALAAMLRAIPKIAAQEKLEKGYRVVSRACLICISIFSAAGRWRTKWRKRENNFLNLHKTVK